MVDKTKQEPENYWTEMHLGDGFSCPNVSFFRFLQFCGSSLKNRKVLEIGFGANRGKDLLECQSRGAKIWGVDINESYIKSFKNNNPKIPTMVMNAGKDEFPFKVNFDLIFSRDVIYYLTNDQIEFHFEKSYQNLNTGGHLVFQFIEKDLMIEVENLQQSKKINFDALKKSQTSKMYRQEVNPIRSLDIDFLIKKSTQLGFKLIATKTLIESHTSNESILRVERYLLLEK
jgi:trans-aconitate methyltransferase